MLACKSDSMVVLQLVALASVCNSVGDGRLLNICIESSTVPISPIHFHRPTKVAIIRMIATFVGRWKWIGLIGTVLLSMQIFNNLPSPTELQTDANATSWSTTIESDLQANNQAYLINFTAAWCITCQTNDKAA